MPSPDQLRREIARLREDEAKLVRQRSDCESSATKARADARSKRDRASRASPSSARSYFRDAERLEKKASELDRKGAEVVKKIADLSKKRATKEKALDAALGADERRRERDERSRRASEKQHARELARLSQSTVKYVHEVRIIEAARPEKLRVLYLTANPDGDLRVDVEVRKVREAVKKALHRDLVEIDHRPAATSEDLLDGINELRPHIVHFAGHGSAGIVLFDDAEVERASGAESGREVSLEQLARALAATDTPPKLVVLNSCDSLEGADVVLASAAAVVGMGDEVSDIAASVFAARFYSAIASAQPVGAALEQAAVAVDLSGLGEGWKLNALARPDLNLMELVLVEVPSQSSP